MKWLIILSGLLLLSSCLETSNESSVILLGPSISTFEDDPNSTLVANAAKTFTNKADEQGIATEFWACTPIVELDEFLFYGMTVYADGTGAFGGSEVEGLLPMQWVASDQRGMINFTVQGDPNQYQLANIESDNESEFTSDFVKNDVTRSRDKCTATLIFPDE